MAHIFLGDSSYSSVCLDDLHWKFGHWYLVFNADCRVCNPPTAVIPAQSYLSNCTIFFNYPLSRGSRWTKLVLPIMASALTLAQLQLDGLQILQPSLLFTTPFSRMAKVSRFSNIPRQPPPQSLPSLQHYTRTYGSLLCVVLCAGFRGGWKEAC